MLTCKICNKEISNHKSGLAQHVIKTHKINYWEYQINNEKINIPKCVCGNNVLRKGEGCKKSKVQGQIKFKKYCGKVECLRKYQSIKHLEYMKNNPEKTAWRLSNLSYPEKCFQDECYRREFDKKYLIIREYSVFPYFIDFAFVNEKIAVEIDGQQHEIKERKLSDKNKDNILLKNGWRVLRFTAKQINKSLKECFDELINFIETTDLKYEKCGIEEYKSKSKIKSRVNNRTKKEFNLTELEIKGFIKQRKVKERPSYEVLLNEIKNLGYVKTGKKYGVSDNAVRKWIKMYEKYN